MSEKRTTISSRTTKFDLPKTIKVGPFVYDLAELSKEDANIAGVLGACNTDRQIIKIRTDATDQTRAATILHEALHAIFKSSGLIESENIAHYEEMIVSQFEIGLIALIRDNPDFVPLLQRLLARNRK